jgi:hypothetical protein
MEGADTSGLLSSSYNNHIDENLRGVSISSKTSPILIEWKDLNYYVPYKK